MHDEPLLFEKLVEGKYPEPAISVNLAWAHMQDILDREMPDTHSAPAKIPVSRLAIYGLAVCLLLMAALWFWQSAGRSAQLETDAPEQESHRPANIPAAAAAPPSPSEAVPSTVTSPSPSEASAIPSQPRTATVATPDSHASHSLTANPNPNPSNWTLSRTGSNQAFANQHRKPRPDPPGAGQTPDGQRPTLPAGRGTSKDAQTTTRKPGISQRQPASVNYLFTDPVQIAAFQPKPAQARTSARQSKNPTGHLLFGSQWNALAPIPSGSHYFTGTDGRSDPWLLAVPDIWLGWASGRNSGIRLQFRAWPSTLASYKQVSSTQDSITRDSITTTRRLLKTSGMAIGLHYTLRLSDRWSAAAGLSYHRQKQALVEKQTVNITGNRLLTDSLLSLKTSSGNWPNLQPAFWAGELELSYRLKDLQIGTAVSMPLNSLSPNPGASVKPLNAWLFLRLGFGLRQDSRLK